MQIAKTEDEWAERVRSYLKAELARADVTYVELAKRLRRHGFKDETEASITNKLARGPFQPRSFWPALPPWNWTAWPWKKSSRFRLYPSVSSQIEERLPGAG